MQVQSGVARTGKWWGHEHFDGGEPDVLLFAKGIGSGYPFAGMATKDHLWDGLPPGTMGEFSFHFHFAFRAMERIDLRNRGQAWCASLSVCTMFGEAASREGRRLALACRSYMAPLHRCAMQLHAAVLIRRYVMQAAPLAAMRWGARRRWRLWTPFRTRTC